MAISSFEFSKIAGGFLLAIALGMSLTLISDHIFSHAKLTTPAYDIPVSDGESSQSGAAVNAARSIASAAATNASHPENLAPAPAVARLSDDSAIADVKAGEADAKACGDCDRTEKGAAAKAGPPLFAIVDHPKGSVRGLAQSNSMKAEGAKWTVDDLDQFLADPKVALSATKTAYAGGRDSARRADIIEYLRILSDHPRRAKAK